MPISAVDAVSPAFQHAKQQLFQPFKIGQWAKLAFVGFLAGEMSSSGGCNIPNIPASGHGGRRQLLNYPLPHLDPATLAILIGVLVATFFVLWIAFMYISSMMRFVLFDSVIGRRCEIGKSWNRRTTEGFRYFLWQLGFSVVTLAILAVVVGIPLLFAFSKGWLKTPQNHVGSLILGGLLLFFVFGIVVLLIAIVHVLTKDFVVPQMALENVGAVEGWRRLWPRITAEKGGYAGYVGMKIVLAIGAGIIFGIISFIVLLIILIPVGGLGAIAVLGGKAAGLHWDVYTITAAVVAGCVVVALLLYLFSLISVPVIVFFPAYSLYFLASRYPPLVPLLYPAVPASPPVSSLPQISPPETIG